MLHWYEWWVPISSECGCWTVFSEAGKSKCGLAGTQSRIQVCPYGQMFMFVVFCFIDAVCFRGLNIQAMKQWALPVFTTEVLCSWNILNNQIPLNENSTHFSLVGMWCSLLFVGEEVHFILFSEAFNNTLLFVFYIFYYIFFWSTIFLSRNEWNICCWLNTNRKQWNQSSFSNSGLLECLLTQFSLFSFSHATAPRCDPVSTDPCVSEEWGQQRNSGAKHSSLKSGDTSSSSVC